MPEPVSWQGESLHLHLYVQPKSNRDGFAERHGDELRLRITAPPVDGKANAHLIKWLAKSFGVPKSAVRLRAGDASRHKWLIVERPRKIPTAVQALLDGTD